MDLVGKIKILNGTQVLGDNGFRKREVVITTDEKYPQHLLIEFTQDKCELLDNYAVGQDVKISINLRGREWINPEGLAKYFNSFQGWRIELLNTHEAIPNVIPQTEQASFIDDDPDNDLPF